ncbi:putative hemolysin [Parapusillimonas sp. JC17]|uniref:putative hemolysin n=1 Tax=Parapusillimonas sp. JC17 TaxID=3445768 RepID=UPI003FA0D623
MYKFGSVLVAVSMIGCTVSGPDPMRAVGMPNPASVYCIERGGTLDIKQRPEGDVTMCVLSDGTRIEEWELYRKNHPRH